MTTLDRRDRRRAEKIALMIDAKYWNGHSGLVTVSMQLIAAALKREREEAGMGAINWFLFSEKSTKAKAKRAIAQKYCTRKHLDRAKARKALGGKAKRATS